MKHQVILSIVSLSLFIYSCSPKVVEFLNDDMDFSNYETYRLITFKPNERSFSDTGKAYFDSLEFSIRRNMKEKSFQSANSNSDLVVRYEIITTTSGQSVQQNNYYNQLNYYQPPQATGIYQEGVLLIEFLDRKKKKLVWQASLDIRYPKNKDKVTVIKNAIDKIFSTYPYTAGSNDSITD